MAFCLLSGYLFDAFSGASDDRSYRIWLRHVAALLDLPLGNPIAFTLFAHCFTCGKDILAAKRIAEQLTMHGVGVLRFDFTGLGGSDG